MLGQQGVADGDHGDALARIERRHGRKIVRDGSEEVAAAEFPEPLAYLWRWFAEIISGCVATGFAPRAIGWTDLMAWRDLTGNALEPWESRLLISLASLRNDILREKTEQAGPT